MRGMRTVVIVVVTLMIASILAVVSAAPSQASATVTVARGWVLGADGQVSPVGGAPAYGSVPARTGVVPAAIVATPSGKGYYVADSDGRVSAFGDAVWRGDVRSLQLSRPVVDMAVHPDNTGYALLGSDGGVFNFGALAYRGSVPQFVPLAALRTKAVAIMAAPDGNGYSIVHDDGGVFAFGSAQFYGSVPEVVPSGQLASPVTDAFPSDNKLGYSMLGSDGGIFSFRSSFNGSRAGAATFVAATTVLGDGYVLLDSTGGVHWMRPNGFASGRVVEGSATISAAAIDIAIIGKGQAEVAPPTAPPPTVAQPPTPTQPPVSGAVTVFSNYTQNAGPGVYFEPNLASLSNWGALATGDAILNVDVLSKPSSKPIKFQVCFWYLPTGKFTGNFGETCGKQTTFTGESSFSINLGRPDSWWSKNGSFQWNKGPTVVRIMLKDPTTKKLMMSSRCGSACYKGGDLAAHVPIKLRATLTFNN